MIFDSRPALYRDRMAAAFAGANEPVLHWPAFAPRAIETTWPSAADFDAVLFTSQIAVGLVPPGEGWQAKTAYAVGDATEAALRAACFTDVVRTGYDAKDMTQALASAPFKRAFYPSAKTVAADLAVAFPGQVARRAVYDMVPEPALPSDIRFQLEAAERVIAPLFSRRSADHLGALLSGLKTPIDAVGISAAVFETPGPWRQRVVARHPTLDSVVAEVYRLTRGED